jgi:hypothetical protein
LEAGGDTKAEIEAKVDGVAEEQNEKETDGGAVIPPSKKPRTKKAAVKKVTKAEAEAEADADGEMEVEGEKAEDDGSTTVPQLATTPALAAAPAAVDEADASKWKCVLCTFENEKKKGKCGMCGNKKGAGAEASHLMLAEKEGGDARVTRLRGGGPAKSTKPR